MLASFVIKERLSSPSSQSVVLNPSLAQMVREQTVPASKSSNVVLLMISACEPVAKRESNKKAMSNFFIGKKIEKRYYKIANKK
jgi:hypothetical protein